MAALAKNRSRKAEHNHAEATSSTTTISTFGHTTDADPDSEQGQNGHPGVSIGYPGFYDFMSTDKDFLVLRRFSSLNTRILVALQWKISELEKELVRLERPNNGEKPLLLDSLGWDYDEDNPMTRRVEIVEELRPLLREYNDHMLAFSRLRGQSSATQTQLKSVTGWLDQFRGAVTDNEQDFVREEKLRPDLIAVNEQVKTRVQLFCEACPPLQWLLKKRRAGRTNLHPGYRLYSSWAMRTVSDVLIITFGLLLLFGPLWWLNWVKKDEFRLAIITGFVTLFAWLLRFLSEGKPPEVLAATAAYAAVLMVFVQKQNDQGA